MMSNNKILTVSYGTFSCTLEGFDDSFGTMKAIAEYFRDLASEDRYFGAEPPVPDAEMLQRIAEREISRRVDAREHQGKIFLSAAEDAMAAESVPPSESRVQTQAAEHDAAKAEADAQAVAEAEAEAARAAQSKAEAEAEIARVQDALAHAATQSSQDEAADEQEDDADIDVSEAIMAPTLEPAPAPRDLAAELPQAEAFFAQAPETTETYETDVLDDQAASALNHAATGDSIASKLERIRAVVSQSEKDAVQSAAFSEDEHAEATTAPEAENADVAAVQSPAENEALSAALSDVAAASAADDAADAYDRIEASFDDEEDDDFAAILASLSEDSDADAEETTLSRSDDFAAEEVHISAATDTEESKADNLFEADEDDTTANEEDDILDLSALLEEDSQDDEAEQDAIEAKAQAKAEAQAQAPARPLARVIKVKRADLEAAIAQGDLEEVDEPVPSTLSEDDEAELARDLAAVEAELPAQEPAPHHGRDALEDNDEDDLSRLLAQADEHMHEEEGAQRRDAFAHLRAAVAAKKADTGLVDPTPEEEEDAYRTDLATVVKPRRPETGGKRSERPASIDRPAPLKLVAEQRIDAPAQQPSEPVRPRRVAALTEAAPASDEGENHVSFADFAEDVGAQKLPDLLEAAAAYLSFVEGKDVFSRPQLMTKVRQVEKEDFSREDGLRSFGQLLRVGKIEKLKGGRFAVTGEIGFRPDARQAG